MRNPTVSQIPEGFHRLKLAETRRFQIVSACGIYLETWCMSSFRNWNFLITLHYRNSADKFYTVICLPKRPNTKYISILVRVTIISSYLIIAIYQNEVLVYRNYLFYNTSCSQYDILIHFERIHLYTLITRI